MAGELRMALAALLRKAHLEQDADCLRAGVRVLSEALIELEVSQHPGADRHERSATRTGQRNGYRERQWDTRVGSIELRVPPVRDGSYFQALAEVERFRTRRLEGPYPYVCLDATFVKVRDGGRVVSQAIVIAIGLRQSGEPIVTEAATGHQGLAQLTSI